MSVYGVTPQGFVPKPFAVIFSEVQADLRGTFGAGADLSPQEPLGQLAGIMANREASLWEMAQEVYAARYPDSATGASADGVASITGTMREGAKPSAVTVTCTGTPGASIPAGRVFSVQGVPSARFLTLEDATIGGAGTVDVPCASEVDGPVAAPAGTLTVVETPTAGLASILNPLDAEPGRLADTDAELRLRREQELRGQGSTAAEAIRSRLLKVEGVAACTVFENDTAAVDADGLPPHSVEALVEGGDDAEIAAAIYAAKAAGIQAFGSVGQTVEDSQGIDHAIAFSRPQTLAVHVALSLKVDPDTFPVDGVAQVQAALVAYGDRVLASGRDVVASALGSQAFAVSGVLDAGLPFIALAPLPSSSATIPVSRREIARLDTSRITVATTPAVP